MTYELRIGNIIGWIDRSHEANIPITGFPQKVYKISIDECLAYQYQLPEYQASDDKISRIDSRDICGIPLNEQWLQRLEFNFIPNDEGGIRLYENEFRDQITFENGKFYFQWPSRYVGEIEIKYVHQLQNLYFALNEGKELTLKTSDR